MLKRTAFLIASVAAAAGLTAGAVPQGYAEPQVCAGCHRQIAESYARTGMARSIRPVAKTTALPGFDGQTFFHASSRELFTFTTREGIPWIRRSQTDTGGAEKNVFEERVDYIFGAGDQAISFLHRTRDNKLTEFPVSWYAENGGHWAMSPSYDRPDHPGFSREVNYACMVCHNAYPASALNGETSSREMPGETIFPQQLPEGIDCQRCHGPGQNHVNAATQGKSPEEIRTSVVNPARLNPERRNEVCLQCHLETTSSRLPASLVRAGRDIFSWRPGEPLADFMLAFDRAGSAASADSLDLVSAPYRLAQSPCVRTGGMALTCTQCHDPHGSVSREESSRKTDEVCASCHRTLNATHSSTRDCASCHMRKRASDDVVHATTTDHRISKPQNITPPAAEVNARNTLPYAGAVGLYYPKLLEQTPENAVSVAIAQVQSNPAEALRLLERFNMDDWAERPEIAAEIAHALLSLGQTEKAIGWYGQALDKSPGRGDYLTGLGNAQATAGRPDLAAQSFARAYEIAPWETDTLFSLGEYYAKEGRLADAIRVLRDAVSRNPESAPAHNDLGSLLLRMGGNGAALQEAESSLREAVRIQPELSSLRMNFADALLRQQKIVEAREQLEEAIRIGGRGETAEAAWFTALIVTGDVQTALRAWRSSFSSQVAGAHNNLGTIYASENRPDDAIREYRLAVEGDPRSILAQFNLGLTLFGRGLKEEAIPYLKKAAESPDAGIRASALSMLETR